MMNKGKAIKEINKSQVKKITDHSGSLKTQRLHDRDIDTLDTL